MLSGSEASAWATPPVWWDQMLRCAQHDTWKGLFHGMPWHVKGPFLRQCYEKGSLVCHSGSSEGWHTREPSYCCLCSCSSCKTLASPCTTAWLGFIQSVVRNVVLPPPLIWQQGRVAALWGRFLTAFCA